METGTINVGDGNLAIKAPEQPEQKVNHSKLPIILAIIFAAIVVIAVTIIIVVLNSSETPTTPTSPELPEDVEEVKSYMVLDDYYGYGFDLEKWTNSKSLITSYTELQNFYSDIEDYYLESIDPDIYYNEPTDCAGGPEGTDCESYIETQVPIETPIKKIDELNEEFFDEHDLIITSYINMACGGGFNRIRSVSKEGDTVTTEIGYDGSCGVCAEEFLIILVEIEKNFASESDTFVTKHTRENNPRCDHSVVEKPMIYLYPEEETKASVKLGNPAALTTTYPKYSEKTGWQVTARPDGTLISSDREYYGLYWESNNEIKQKEDGFIVAGEDTVKFLEEKLAILGLNEHEINEFIVYWLPKMEHNNFNYIRFATSAEIEEIMPLSVSPKPDTIIRVLMEFKALDKEIEIEEQKLDKASRKGFSVVEWGGTEIK